MSTDSEIAALAHAMQTARAWVDEVARQFGTDDREFAYRVLRGWLQTLRDRLTVEVAAHFAAQLPDLIRGIFYAGWDPTVVPIKYEVGGYSVRFARTANIAVQDCGVAAPTVTAALMRLLPPPLIDKVLHQLPEGVRTLLWPAATGRPLDGGDHESSGRAASLSRP